MASCCDANRFVIMNGFISEKPILNYILKKSPFGWCFFFYLPAKRFDVLSTEEPAMKMDWQSIHDG